MVNAQRRYPLFPAQQIDCLPVSPTAINVSKDKAAYQSHFLLMAKMRSPPMQTAAATTDALKCSKGALGGIGPGDLSAGLATHVNAKPIAISLDFDQVAIGGHCRIGDNTRNSAVKSQTGKGNSGMYVDISGKPRARFANRPPYFHLHCEFPCNPHFALKFSLFLPIIIRGSYFRYFFWRCVCR